MRSQSEEVRARRRRGEELLDVIYRACLDELTEHGWTALSTDRIAARADTSKTTLYRRWPNKIELVADALRTMAPRFAVPPDTGDLRGDLITVLRSMYDHLPGPLGAGARGLIAEAVRSPELRAILREQFVDPALPPMMEVLRRAVTRGEIAAAALDPLVAGVGVELLRGHVLINDVPVPDIVLPHIVDKVIMPLLRGLSVPSG